MEGAGPAGMSGRSTAVLGTLYSVKSSRVRNQSQERLGSGVGVGWFGSKQLILQALQKIVQIEEDEVPAPCDPFRLHSRLRGQRGAACTGDGTTHWQIPVLAEALFRSHRLLHFTDGAVDEWSWVLLLVLGRLLCDPAAAR
mmetsp:Transcript_35814/g.101335  ORF Transcript_35814/g.101335 Transcript_35814/m.101335 type:complete len:141 (-) Transcript_35814:551-973(-)